MSDRTGLYGKGPLTLPSIGRVDSRLAASTSFEVDVAGRSRYDRSSRIVRTDALAATAVALFRCFIAPRFLCVTLVIAKSSAARDRAFRQTDDFRRFAPALERADRPLTRCLRLI